MFEVDYSTGSAWKTYKGEKESVRMHRYTLMVDNKGVYVKTPNGDIYMTPENSKII